MTEDTIMTFIFYLLVIAIIAMVFRKVYLKYNLSANFSLVPSNAFTPKELFAFILRDKEIKRRCLVTCVIVMFYQICSYIPLPGIDREALISFFAGLSANTKTCLSGSVPLNFSVFALGLMPFISACIFIQLSSLFIPRIKRSMFDGERGRNRIVKCTYILTVILAIIQAYFLSCWLKSPYPFMGLDIIVIDETLFNFMTILTLTAGVGILLFLAGIINKYGIGNGIVMLILSGIIRGYAHRIHRFCFFANGDRGILFIKIIFCLVVLAAFFYIAYYLTSREKRVEVEDISSGTRFSIPLRISLVGTQPFMFVQSVMLLPATLAGIFPIPALRDIANKVVPTSVINSIALGNVRDVFESELRTVPKLSVELSPFSV